LEGGKPQNESKLPDEIINAVMYLLQQEDNARCAADPARLPTLFINSWFASMISNRNGTYDFRSVQRWFRSHNLFGFGKNCRAS
jgi:hypothetical protein